VGGECKKGQKIFKTHKDNPMIGFCKSAKKSKQSIEYTPPNQLSRLG